MIRPTLSLFIMFISNLTLASDTSAPFESEFLPGAFSADELRAGIEAGEHYVFQVDTPAASTQTHMAFAEPTEETVGVISWEIIDGVATEPVEATASWDELATHSLYREDRATRRDDAWCSTTLGVLPGVEYEVAEEDGSVVRVCFASEFPGPPVRYEIELEGVTVFGMVLIAHEISPLAR